MLIGWLIIVDSGRYLEVLHVAYWEQLQQAKGKRSFSRTDEPQNKGKLYISETALEHCLEQQQKTRD